MTTNGFNWTEEVSLIVEQQSPCAPYYFFYYDSTDGGQTYQEFYEGYANQLAMSFGNFQAGTVFYYAVRACDAYCSGPGFIDANEDGPGLTNFSYYGQRWYYQNAGFVNNGGGWTGEAISQNPSGADQYIGILQTPQSGTNLANLGESFTYIDAYTNNGTFYQVGYSLSSAGFREFAATTYAGGGYNSSTGQWGGIGCASGSTRTDFPPGTVRGVTVRCDKYMTPPNTSLQYDVHVYTNVVFEGINGSFLLDSLEANLGYVYKANVVQEMVGGAASPQTTLGSGSPTRSTGDVFETYFALGGVAFPDIVPDYYVSTDLFDDNNAITAPACGFPVIGSIQRETIAEPWDMRWDTGLPDC